MILEGIIGTFTPEVNFWELYPNLLLLEPFKKFKGRDRTAGGHGERSSKEMWGFAFLYDMGHANYLRSLPEDTRKEWIANDILKQPNYDWNKEAEVSELMQKLCQPAPQRALYDLQKKMDDRMQFIHNTDYSLDSYGITPDGKKFIKKGTADQLDKMMINTNKIFEQIEFWQKNVLLERETRSSKPRSETDEGEM